MKKGYCKCTEPDEYLDIEDYYSEPKKYCSTCDFEVKEKGESNRIVW